MSSKIKQKDIDAGSATDGQILTFNTSSGEWEAQDNTLQSAYAGGNTVTVTAANGAVTLNATDAVSPLTVQDGGSDVLVVSAAGAVTATPTSGQNLVLTVGGAGVMDATIDTAADGLFSVDSVSPNELGLPGSGTFIPMLQVARSNGVGTRVTSLVAPTEPNNTAVVGTQLLLSSANGSNQTTADTGLDGTANGAVSLGAGNAGAGSASGGSSNAGNGGTSAALALVLSVGGAGGAGSGAFTAGEGGSGGDLLFVLGTGGVGGAGTVTVPGRNGGDAGDWTTSAGTGGDGGGGTASTAAGNGGAGTGIVFSAGDGGDAGADSGGTGGDAGDGGNFIIDAGAAGSATGAGAAGSAGEVRIAVNNATNILSGTGATISWAHDGYLTATGGLSHGNIVTTSGSPASPAIGTILRVRTTTDGAVTVNLPTISAANAGLAVTIKDVQGNAAANNITVNTPGGDTIDTAANRVMSSNNEGLVFVSDGLGDWMTF